MTVIEFCAILCVFALRVKLSLSLVIANKEKCVERERQKYTCIQRPCNFPLCSLVVFHSVEVYRRIREYASLSLTNAQSKGKGGEYTSRVPNISVRAI